MNPFFASKFFPASLTLAEEEGLAWCRCQNKLARSLSLVTCHLPRRRGSLGAGVRSSLLGHLASRTHMKINNAFNKLYINNTLKL